jgi:hypothetical protein
MKDELLALPQDEDVWVAGAQLLTVPVRPGGEEQAVWLLLVQSRTQYVVVGMHTNTAQPSPQDLLTTLVNTMFEPKVGASRRPAAVERGPNLTWDPVVPMLEQIGIAVRPAGSLFDLNTAFQHLSIQMSGRMLPNLPIGPK